jgi:hypothetical protein
MRAGDFDWRIGETLVSDELISVFSYKELVV